MSAMTITTDAQAEAVAISAEKLWMFIDFICSRNLESILGQDLLQRYNDDHDALRAALAAYEAQKAANIVLSEDAITVLKFAVIDSNAPFEELRMHGLIWKGSTLGITDAGRAYLAAQKPEMRWEVWCKTYERDEPQEAQIGLFRTNVWAEHLRRSLEKAFPHNTYEVREVR